MKFLALAVIIFLLSATNSFAGNNNGPDFGGEQEQHQNAFGGNGGNAKQGQFQNQDQNAVAAQKQLGVVGQSAANDQTTNIGGDETDVTTAVWPTTQSTEGKAEQTIYSLFGGIGNNKSEAHIRFTHQMQITEKLFKDGVIDDETYKKDILASYKALKKSNADTKVLGVLPFGCKNPILGTTICF